jgi:hypothetical protein
MMLRKALDGTAQGRVLAGCQARFGCDSRESCERYRVFQQSPLIGFHAVQTCRTTDFPHWIHKSS